jgi:4'-phosphopantetheinyl transferase
MPGEGRTLTIHCEGPLHAEPMPAAGAHLGKGTVHLWASLLADQRHALDAHLALLDPEERARAERFRHARDRERYITAHGLLRRLLGHYLAADPAAARIDLGTYGKPFVAGTDLRFNLSDTKDAVVIALTRGSEIGADIETVDRVVDHRAVADHYFTPEEVSWIGDAGTESTSKRRFLELWTRKEAVLKASGVGIMDDLRVLRVDGPVNAMTIAHEAFVVHAAPAYHVRTWHLGATHIVSTAMDVPVADIRFFSVPLP